MMLTNIKSEKSSFTHLGYFICDNLWDHIHTMVWIELVKEIGDSLFHQIRYRIEFRV